MVYGLPLTNGQNWQRLLGEKGTESKNSASVILNTQLLDARISSDILIIKIWQIGTLTFTSYSYIQLLAPTIKCFCCIDIEICPWVISCAETIFWWSVTPWKITEKSVHMLPGNDPNLLFCLLIMVLLMKICVTYFAWNRFCGGKHMPDMWSSYIEPWLAYCQAQPKPQLS